MSTFQEKATIAAVPSLLFLALNSQFAYQLTNAVGLGTAVGGCPTPLGTVLHTVVYFLIVYALMMGDKRSSSKTKADRSLTSSLLFFAFASPTLYALTGSAGGCPDFRGVLLHSVLFFLALIGVMYL